MRVRVTRSSATWSSPPVDRPSIEPVPVSPIHRDDHGYLRPSSSASPSASVPDGVRAETSTGGVC